MLKMPSAAITQELSALSVLYAMYAIQAKRVEAILV
jgi:hypothetical protein